MVWMFELRLHQFFVEIHKKNTDETDRNANKNFDKKTK